MAQTSEFDLPSQVKTCFDCKMFDVANWVACLNGEDGTRGTPSHETLQFHLKEHWRYPQTIQQPPSLVTDHFGSPKVVAKSHNCDEELSTQILTDA